jgi:hypothetical protein
VGMMHRRFHIHIVEFDNDACVNNKFKEYTRRRLSSRTVLPSLFNIKKALNPGIFFKSRIVSSTSDCRHKNEPHKQQNNAEQSQQRVVTTAAILAIYLSSTLLCIELQTGA